MCMLFQHIHLFGLIFGGGCLASHAGLFTRVVKVVAVGEVLRGAVAEGGEVLAEGLIEILKKNRKEFVGHFYVKGV
jgi:hypothetical protein